MPAFFFFRQFDGFPYTHVLLIFHFSSLFYYVFFFTEISANIANVIHKLVSGDDNEGANFI